MSHNNHQSVFHKVPNPNLNLNNNNQNQNQSKMNYTFQNSDETQNIHLYCHYRNKLYQLKKEKEHNKEIINHLQEKKNSLVEICNNLNTKGVLLPDEKLLVRKKIQTTTNTINEEKITEVMADLRSVYFSISGDGLIKYLKEIENFREKGIECKSNNKSNNQTKKRKRDDSGSSSNSTSICSSPYISSLAPNSVIANKLGYIPSFKQDMDAVDDNTVEFSYSTYVNNFEQLLYEQIQKRCVKTSETIQVQEVSDSEMQKWIKQATKSTKESPNNPKSIVLLNQISLQEPVRQKIKQSTLQYYNTINKVNETKNEISFQEKDLQKKMAEIEPTVCKFLQRQVKSERKFNFSKSNDDQCPTAITLKFCPKKNNYQNDDDNSEDSDQSDNEVTNTNMRCKKIGLKPFRVILRISMEEALFECLNKKMHLDHKKISWNLLQPILYEKLLSNLHLLKKEFTVPVKKSQPTDKKPYTIRAAIEE